MVHRKKTVVALIVVAALLVIIVLLERTPERGVRVHTASRPLPTIHKSAISALEVRRAGSVAKLARTPDRWQLATSPDHPVDKQAIDAALQQLADLSFGDLVTAQPTRHAELGVDEASGLRVIVYAGDAALADIFLGRSIGGATMLRRATSDAVHPAVGELRPVFDRLLATARQP